MTDNNSDHLPLGIVEAIGKAAAFNQSNAALPDQIPHSRRLREVGFNGAVKAIRDYKKQHPEAASKRAYIDVRGYEPKPPGYFPYIDRLVDGWLSGKGDCNQTNRAIISRISERFPEYKFSKDLLNKPLSKAMADRIKAKAAERGLSLDTRQHDTLSKIKAAALKGELAKDAERPIRINATLTDTHLAGLKIELSGKRQSVRFTHGGKRRRIYIDDLMALSELMAGEAEDNQSLSSVYTIETLVKITPKPAELRQEASENDVLCSDAGLTGDVRPETLVKDCDKPAETLSIDGRLLTGDIGQNAPEPTLTERIAALSAYCNPVDATEYPPDYDPLCHD